MLLRTSLTAVRSPSGLPQHLGRRADPHLNMRPFRHLVDFAVCASALATDGSASEMCHVSCEFRRTVDPDYLRRLSGFVEDLDLTRLDHEKLTSRSPTSKSFLTAPVPFERRVRAAQ